jgi:hypothetical protein
MAINASAIWRVRPSGSNTNGGGYDPGIAGAATDYSQQNAAQASGSAGTATGTTTFTDAVANNFTSTMVGNAIWIASGAGFTVGAYFVTAYTSASQVTLDRSPGTGTVAIWKLGGGWADFVTNTTSSGPLVPGNFVYILGSGTPNPASYTYDYTLSGIAPASGNATAGSITFANDPATPGYKAAPDTTGGMPCILISTGYLLYNLAYIKIVGLWLVSGGGTTDMLGQSGGGSFVDNTVFGCVLDQNGYDVTGVSLCLGSAIIGCEIFSSVTPGSSGAYPAIAGVFAGNAGLTIIGCNVHDTVGPGIYTSQPTIVSSTIVAKCRGYGIYGYDGGVNYYPLSICNCTIDGNAGNGIEITTQGVLSSAIVLNNILSNHTQAGTYGLTVDAGTTAQNNAVKGFVDFNTFYNNTTDVNAISYGPHDTHGGSNPYVGQSTENYTLA